MNDDYKLIVRKIKIGDLPNATVVERFHRDSLLMTSYPDKGEEFYVPFRQAIDTFVNAVRGENIAQAKTALGQVDHLRKTAHRRYK
ncbi:MAG: GAK system XXXCH domain-containing protein [Myxococcales bacterium]|nr:MAG: GAK system XXXCH domain-containing protein [Myxococcales bacterium]